MKCCFLYYLFFLFFSTGYTRPVHFSSQNLKISARTDDSLSLSLLKDGKYLLTYQNGMSDRLDLRKILFRNKKEAKSLLEKISRALTAKDGVSNIFVYGNYRIRLLTQIGGVFMIVEEKGLTQSTLRISKENYEQINMT